jgi:hypothetical protein
LQFTHSAAAIACSGLTAQEEGFAPGLQLMDKQAFLAAPRMQCVDAD